MPPKKKIRDTTESMVSSGDELGGNESSSNIATTESKVSSGDELGGNESKSNIAATESPEDVAISKQLLVLKQKRHRAYFKIISIGEFAKNFDIQTDTQAEMAKLQCVQKH